MNFNSEDIISAIGDLGAFNRGLKYFQDRKVRAVWINEDDVISGCVIGRGGRQYTVETHVVTDMNRRLQAIHGHCSCPVGYNCKHIVAALLEAVHKTKEQTTNAVIHKRKDTDPDLPRSLQIWLDSLSISNDLVSANEQSDRSKNKIFYVFRSSHTNTAEIVPYKAYLKKDGTIGKNADPFKASSWHSSADQTLEDVTILAQMRFFNPLTYSQPNSWPHGETLRSFLQMIVSTGRARAGDIRGPELAWSEPRFVSFQWETDEEGNQKLTARDEANEALSLLPFPDPVFMDQKTGMIGFAKTNLPAKTASAFAQAPIIPPHNVPDVAKILGKQDSPFPTPNAIKITERTDLVPHGHIRLYGHEHKSHSYYVPPEIRGAKVTYPCAQLSIRYDGVKDPVPLGTDEDIRISDKDNLTIIHRNHAAEYDLAMHLEMYATEFEGYDPVLMDYYGRMPKKLEEADAVFPPILPGESLASNPALAFITQALPELRQDGWEIEFDVSWPFRMHEGEIEFHTDLEPSGTSFGSDTSSVNDWFSLTLKLELDGMELDLTPTILQIVESLPLDTFGELHEEFDISFFLSEIELYPQLPDGRFVPIPGERLAGFVEAFLETNGFTNFHLAEAGRVAAIADALDGCGAPWKGGKEILELGRSLQKLNDRQEIEPPSLLKGDLRPYQKVGYGWLNALSDSSYGGILADDMGLGKSVQALALLVQRHLIDDADKPSLLVIPTSLIGNWQNEVSRFAPDLKLLTLHGPDRRDRFCEIPDHHLIMTTYPLVNRDHQALFAYEYDLTILDEAQAVKNPASSIAKRVRDIRDRQRIALTGTPLENNLTELWSIYDWLIPGLLGDRKKFTADYRTPIERHGDRARQQQLSTRIKPFLLRRTKDEVAKDLPPKTIIDEAVTLTGKQAALYESVRTTMDKRVREAIKTKGLAGSHITVLDALLKLRQVCCDPSLVKLEAATKVKESAKRERLMEILTELIQEGRHILIFSQFVEMLRLIEADLQAAGWDYAMLHGQTKKRADEIKRFQSGKVSIFLISLKAGGTGLNLTAADTVILYDPWWNPAVERQAMDRAHRIGQDKPVFVHRLLAHNSVETAIQTMQDNKQAMADALFEGTSGGPMALTEDDLAQLFGAS